jgi:hypothetical protein
MGEKHSFLRSCPCEDCGVVCARQADILNTNHVEVGVSPKYATDDIVIEVLVRGQFEHGTSSPAGSAGEKAGPNAARLEPLLVLAPDFCGLLLLARQVMIHLIPVAKVVGKHGVNIA